MDSLGGQVLSQGICQGVEGGDFMSANLASDTSDAARQPLGPPVTEHGPGLERWLRVIGCGVLAALLLAGAIWAALSGIAGLGWLALALALLTVLAAAGLVIQARRLKWRALLHRDGLILERNGPPEVLPWSDVKYCIERNVNGHYSVRLRLADERLIFLDANLRDHHALGAAVRQGVTRAVLARAAGQLERREEVPFGPLKVSREGLSNGKEQIRWDEVSELGAVLNFSGSGYKVEVCKKGATLAWFSRPAIDFPNAEAFLQLASQFTRVTRPG
jgi:hypothetical protein